MSEATLTSWAAGMVYKHLCAVEAQLLDGLPRDAEEEFAAAVEPFSWDDHDADSLASAMDDLEQWVREYGRDPRDYQAVTLSR